MEDIRIGLIVKCSAASTVRVGHGVGGHGKLQLGGIFGSLAFKLERLPRNHDRAVDVALGNDVQCRVTVQLALRVSGQGQGDPRKG